jgi:hypothetical protein
VYNYFYALLDQFANILLKLFCTCIHKGYWTVILLSYCVLSGFGVGGMLTLYNKLKRISSASIFKNTEN